MTPGRCVLRGRFVLRGLALALLTSTSGCGCCRIVRDLDPPEPVGRQEPPPVSADGVDLGDAAYPPGNDAAPIEHAFWVPSLDPERYRIGYRMPRADAKGLERSYHQWSASVGHRRISADRFQWRPPTRCLGGLHCVYEELDRQDAITLHPVARRFLDRVRGAALDTGQAAALVLTFVQNIRYQIPGDEPFGVKPPTLVLVDKWGDCDSKSLLAHILLRDLGIESVIISSDIHKHTMLGVALPAPGTSFTHRGRRYAFAELTAERAPLGFIDRKLTRPNDWQVVAMRYNPAAVLPEEGSPPIAGAPAPNKGGPIHLIDR